MRHYPAKINTYHPREDLRLACISQKSASVVASYILKSSMPWTLMHSHIITLAFAPFSDSSPDGLSHLRHVELDRFFFSKAADTWTHWTTDHSFVPSPCGYIDHTGKMVSQTTPPEDLEATCLQQWFLLMSCLMH